MSSGNLSKKIKQAYEDLFFQSGFAHTDKEIQEAHGNFEQFLSSIVRSKIDTANNKDGRQESSRNFDNHTYELDLVRSLLIDGQARKKFSSEYFKGSLRIILQNHEESSFLHKKITDKDLEEFDQQLIALNQKKFQANKSIYQFYQKHSLEDRRLLLKNKQDSIRLKQSKTHTESTQHKVQQINKELTKEEDREEDKEDKIPSTIINLEDSRILQEIETLPLFQQILNALEISYIPEVDPYGNLYYPDFIEGKMVLFFNYYDEEENDYNNKPNYLSIDRNLQEEGDASYTDTKEDDFKEGRYNGRKFVFAVYEEDDLKKLQDQGYSPVIALDIMDTEFFNVR